MEEYPPAATPADFGLPDDAPEGAKSKFGDYYYDEVPGENTKRALVLNPPLATLAQGWAVKATHAEWGVLKDSGVTNTILE